MKMSLLVTFELLLLSRNLKELRLSMRIVIIQNVSPVFMENVFIRRHAITSFTLTHVCILYKNLSPVYAVLGFLYYIHIYMYSRGANFNKLCEYGIIIHTY